MSYMYTAVQGGVAILNNYRSNFQLKDPISNNGHEKNFGKCRILHVIIVYLQLTERPAKDTAGVKCKSGLLIEMKKDASAVYAQYSGRPYI